MDKIKILLCSPVHEKENIFKLHLESVRNLEIPKNVELTKFYFLHNCEDLKQHINGEREYHSIFNNDIKYNKDEITHHWKENNFNAVISMKNLFLDFFIKKDFDYIFFIDSDICLHPKSLTSLLNANKDMISNIFWTKWTPEQEEQPNVWEFDHYLFLEHTMEELKKPQYYRCGMTGACTLIKRDVIASGVNWKPIYNVSFSQWEDRAFCIRVAVNGFEIWTDTHYPAYHLYRESEIEKYLEIKGANNE